MTILECIHKVDAVAPNDNTNEQKARWVWECEGKLWNQVFLMQAGEVQPGVGRDATLSLPVPYDRVYPLYLQAMIHYANGEYDRYANSMAVFNGAWGEVHRWIGGSFDVSNLWRNKRVEAEIDTQYPNVRRGESLDRTIMTIPQGCALVGVRLAMLTPAGRTYPSLVLTEHPLIEGTYCLEVDGEWKHFELVAPDYYPKFSKLWIEGSELKVEPPSGTLPSPELIDGKEGTELDFSIQAQLWVNDPTMPVGLPAPLDERKSTPEPMLIGDIGGTEVGVTLGPGSWDTEGKLILSGRMLVSDEAALWRK